MLLLAVSVRVVLVWEPGLRLTTVVAGETLVLGASVLVLIVIWLA